MAISYRSYIVFMFAMLLLPVSNGLADKDYGRTVRSIDLWSDKVATELNRCSAMIELGVKHDRELCVKFLHSKKNIAVVDEVERIVGKPEFQKWLAEKSSERIVLNRSIDKVNNAHERLRILIYGDHREKKEYVKLMASQLAEKNQYDFEAEFSRSPYKDKIEKSSLRPYSEGGYPKTVKEFKARLNEVEMYRLKAAEKALASGKCDYVQISELSTKSTLSNLMFFVDCSNGQRVRLTEREMDTDAKVLTQSDKAWSKELAIVACKAGIKDRVNYPSTVKYHDILGLSYYKGIGTDNVVINLDFDAKNAFGLELEYTARCIFPPGEDGEIVITSK